MCGENRKEQIALCVSEQDGSGALPPAPKTFSLGVPPNLKSKPSASTCKAGSLERPIPQGMDFVMLISVFSGPRIVSGINISFFE